MLFSRPNIELAVLYGRKAVILKLSGSFSVAILRHGRPQPDLVVESPRRLRFHHPQSLVMTQLSLWCSLPT